MRILIVDDHALMRRGMAYVVKDGFPDADVVEAESASAALDVMRERRPISRSSTSGCRSWTGWNCSGR